MQKVLRKIQEKQNAKFQRLSVPINPEETFGCSGKQAIENRVILLHRHTPCSSIA